MPSYILGISAYYHDSAAALLKDGEIIAAVQEERFTRKKHDAGFPSHAIRYVMSEAAIDPSDLTAVVFYEKPLIKFERLLETYHAFAPRGFKSFATAIPVWIKDKLFMKQQLRKKLKETGIPNQVPLLFPEHHLSHAASAFFPSPFEKAAILTIDGVGEWATTTIGIGEGNQITLLKELHFPHSVGLLYSAFTYYCGFKVNSGEYKLMGLAPYGQKGSKQVEHFKELILKHLVDIRPDGSILLNMKYFNYATGLTMTSNRRWKALFGFPPRQPNEPISQPYMDMALAIQEITDHIVIQLAQTARKITGCSNLVMAGGVALNCVSNSKILENKIFDDIWIQPAAGDAGGALGAALAAWHIYFQNTRPTRPLDSMQGAYLGPSYTNEYISKIIDKFSISASYFENFNELAEKVASLIAEGNVVGWFQGRMEYGPRALGNRSILGDARNPEMQKRMNLKIKFRESFRPFAPSLLEEDSLNFMEHGFKSPYMLLIDKVKKERCYDIPEHILNSDKLFDRLYFVRSDIPAVTHIDYTARIQTVNKQINPRFWTLINAFKKLTGYGILINTSFNVRGEPIVCSPEDALRCFVNTDIDYLVLNNFLLAKTDVISIKEKLGQYVFDPD
ncbi:MAG: carbamoyltransferase [Bacteroidales bacterium]|nr:carbamoyltransferase [Bacteroidales bacterium]